MAEENGITDAEPAGGIAENDPASDGAGAGSGKSDGKADAENSGGGIADGGTESAAKDAADKVDDKKEAPDTSWELTASEDFPLPEENLKSFTEAAKKLGLSKEQAEGMLGWHKEFHNGVQKEMAAIRETTISNWQKELRADAEFGGAHEKATVADARKALAAFDTDGSLRTLLRESGYQFHPAVVKSIARIGKAMGEHDFIGASGNGKAAKTPLYERMYPDMK